MKTKALVQVFISMLIATFGFSEADHSHKSKYAGEEKGEIKSLSATDIEELQNGKGWGLAKAAELNGVPGPAHLLEMKEEIELSAEQIRVIEKIYMKMKQESEQITLYNKLRGYSSDDPCENVPKGHDPSMWKKHHNCP